MIVVDASALVHALAAETPDPVLVDRLLMEDDLRAPHLVDIEVVHALRRLAAIGEISAERAADARLDYTALRLVRYPHLPLLDRIWALRDNLTAYDATYVSLAEILDVPLVTCDQRLLGAPGHQARVEVFGLAA